MAGMPNRRRMYVDAEPVEVPAGADFLRAALHRSRVLTREGEQALFRLMERRQAQGRFAEATRIRNLIVNANLRLAAKITWRVAENREQFAELFSVACEGLMKAVDRHDWRKGFRLSTYATPWIRHAFSHRVEKANAAKRKEPPRASNRFLTDVPDHREKGFDDTADHVQSTIRTELNSGDRQCVESYFGIGCDEPATLEQVGQRFGFTGERSRQRISRGIERLKQSERMLALL